MNVGSLSIVTIVRDDHVSVRRLARSIAALSPCGVPVELVVVDDGSERAVSVPETVVPTTVVRLDGPGNRAAARNAGAAAAAGTHVAFIDSDQELPPHWAAEHVRWHERRPGTLATGHRRHREHDDRWLPEVRSRITAVYSENSARVISSWYLAFSCNISLSTAAFREVAGFDEGYAGWGFEDSDFGYRLYRSGVPTELVPRGWSWDNHHDVRTDTDRVSEWEANRHRFINRHRDPVAQATMSIDNYPDGHASSPGHEWTRSYRQFDDRARAHLGLDLLPRSEETITVLSAVDATYARQRILAGASISVVDGFPEAELDCVVNDYPAVEYRIITDR